MTRACSNRRFHDPRPSIANEANCCLLLFVLSSALCVVVVATALVCPEQRRKTRALVLVADFAAVATSRPLIYSGCPCRCCRGSCCCRGCRRTLALAISIYRFSAAAAAARRRRLLLRALFVLALVLVPASTRRCVVVGAVGNGRGSKLFESSWQIFLLDKNLFARDFHTPNLECNTSC